MTVRRKNEILDHLKAKGSDYREVLPALFEVIDPMRANYKELLWLMAMPASLSNESYTVVKSVIKAITPDPSTLEELIDSSYPLGSTFDAIGLGLSFKTIGPVVDAATNTILVGEYACQNLITGATVSLPIDTKIRWIF
jgi:hypothetical protein